MDKSSLPSSRTKVLVVGLGQLGLPVAKYIRERGFDTYGYDISTQAMKRAEKTGSIKKAHENSFGEFDVFVLCVSTHKADDIYSPQIDGLLSIVEEKIAKDAKNGVLVSIESTIPRGTSKKIFEMLNHRVHVAHVPHRWYAVEEKEHGVDQMRVVGGVCGCCLREAMQFYMGSSCANVGTARGIDHGSRSIENLGIPLHPVSNIEIAEITKIAENAHRYLQIAFAEDLCLYCQANNDNINFLELQEALNTKWNVNILEPRDGIGGHCLPKDTKMFLQSSESSRRSKILTAAIEVDQDYRKYRHARGIAAQEIEQSINSQIGGNISLDPLLGMQLKTQKILTNLHLTKHIKQHW